jgi:acyl-CoA thioesterase-1
MISPMFETHLPLRIACRLSRMLLVALAILSSAIPATSFAADKIVVALGASHTFGKGVSRGQDYPAQLQNLLTQKGLEVQVINAGVNG